MKLSDLKPGDRFILDTMQFTEFTLVDPRVGLFTSSEYCKFVYISNTFQLYGSPYDYSVQLANKAEKTDKFPLLKHF